MDTESSTDPGTSSCSTQLDAEKSGTCDILGWPTKSSLNVGLMLLCSAMLNLNVRLEAVPGAHPAHCSISRNLSRIRPEIQRGISKDVVTLGNWTGPAKASECRGIWLARASGSAAGGNPAFTSTGLLVNMS